MMHHLPNINVNGFSTIGNGLLKKKKKKKKVIYYGVAGHGNGT